MIIITYILSNLRNLFAYWLFLVFQLPTDYFSLPCYFLLPNGYFSTRIGYVSLLLRTYRIPFDTNRLPLIESFVNEMLRYSCFVTTTFERITNQDIVVNGFSLPKVQSTTCVYCSVSNCCNPIVLLLMHSYYNGITCNYVKHYV